MSGRQIERELLARDGKRKVEIFRRDDGTYGFTELHWSEEPSEMCWVPFGRYSECFTPDAEAAVAEARSRVEWLAMDALRATLVRWAASAALVLVLVPLLALIGNESLLIILGMLFFFGALPVLVLATIETGQTLIATGKTLRDTPNAPRFLRVVGVAFSVPPKSQAVVHCLLSLALILVLAAIALGVDYPPIVALAVAFACILGVPFLLLSLVDLGRILRAESGGDFQATRTTWLLSHLQAALGAICMAAGGYVAYDNVTAWLRGVEDFDAAALLIRVSPGIGIAITGVAYIWSAFAPGSRRTSGRK